MTITRDEHGIPHVVGDSVLAVARAQGRATAQDRAWQLEVERRRAEGTCAEVFGATAVEWDVLARRALLVDVARRAYAALSTQSRAFVDAYVEGVNEVVERRWQPWTPLAVFAVQHLLFSGFPSQLWRRHLAATTGDEWLPLFRTEGLPGGSNALVVDGSLTASGLPILAGDPHRVIEAPGCYAQVRLVCTDPHDPFDVAGLTFVGVPGVQHFGHAGDVAWGITNAVADDEDVYVEELVRHRDAVIARGASGWEPVAGRVEQVRVRTGADSYDVHEVEVLVTERGPVVVGGPDEPETFSLRTPAYVLGDLGLDAILPLLRSRRARDVTAAFAGWVGPVDNLVVGDRYGRTEHRVVGRIPERDGDRRWTGGWVADLPRRTGPVLVTANDRATPDFERVGSDFAPPHRAHRIRELLDDRAAAGPLTPGAVGAVLGDDRQTAGAALLDTIASLVDLTDLSAALRDRLLAWDRRMAAGSVDAALFAQVRAAVVDGLSDAPALRGVDGSPHGELFAPWFDLRGRIRLCLPAILAAGKPFGVDVLQLVAAALEQVATQPAPAAWGTGHVAVPLTPHQQLGLDAPDGSAPPYLALSGDDDCVLATRALGGTGACLHGPVARWVWDLAGDSRWVVPLGASGDPASPHHHDQQAVWAAGGTIPITRPVTEESA
ncbi:penicillin acylase family protein [Nocardioides carbamazepini]|uniref:penicillin acylase family protein n=1 Tax=Nocardioides carbamazepini TaxID=2854259 RepID=UPI002149B9B7|nr:penicillin acylase family protein [Nocardioides carbamazepini]MCR1785088.1 penicillin acylase family protein [Nocardioides carbamazepini]